MTNATAALATALKDAGTDATLVEVYDNDICAQYTERTAEVVAEVERAHGVKIHWAPQCDGWAEFRVGA
jgi:ABC-type thiamine transport system substrate-binding protein